MHGALAVPGTDDLEGWRDVVSSSLSSDEITCHAAAAINLTNY